MPIKYDDYGKLVSNAVRDLSTLLTGLLSLWEPFLSLKAHTQKRVSGEVKCKIQKLFFLLQSGSIRKLGVLTFI